MIKGNKDLALHAVEALNVGYLAFNTEKKPFDNVLVRQALNYATDKQAIVKAVFLDSGSVAKSPIRRRCSGIRKISRTMTTIRRKPKRCSSRRVWSKARK